MAHFYDEIDDEIPELILHEPPCPGPVHDTHNVRVWWLDNGDIIYINSEDKLCFIKKNVNRRFN